MKSNLKICAAALVFAVVQPLFSQQITKFGVVDTAKVYNAYFRNSASVRNYEKKKAEYQDAINKYTEELQKLVQRKLEYEKKRQCSDGTARTRRDNAEN